MSRAGVLVWLMVAVLLGAGAIWLLRTPPAGPPTRGAVLNAQMAQVVGLQVTPAGGKVQRLHRDGQSGDWLFGPDEKSGWPVQISNIQGALRLLCSLEGRDASPGTPPPGRDDAEVRLVLDDGQEWALRLAARSLGGERLAEVQPPAGPSRVVLVDGQLFDALLDPGPAAWRIPIALPAPDPERITLTTTVGRLVLGRISGRWALQEPVAAPADDEAVRSLLKSLGSIRVSRFLDGPGQSAGLDEPIATAVLVGQRRIPAGDAFDTIVTTRTLTVGSPANIDGTDLFARVDRSIEDSRRPAGPPETAWLAISRESVEAISMDASAYLTPAAIAMPAAEIGSVTLGSTRLTRTIDGWDGAAGDAERIASLLTLLCDSPAQARILKPAVPPGLFGIELATLGGAPLAAVSIGLETSPDGPSLWIVNGQTARIYDPAPWAELLAWIEAKRP